MNKRNQLTVKQALTAALEYAGLAASESICLDNCCDNGLYQILVRTAFMQYEFYVDADCGEVLGFDMEPLQYAESLRFCDSDEDSGALAA